MALAYSWFAAFLLIFITTILISYKYFTRKFDYWKKRGIYCPKPIPFCGNTLDMCLVRKNFAEWIHQFYDLSKDAFIGIFVFDKPTLIIKSPELIKNILIKDFSYFTDRTVTAGKHDTLTSNMLFFQKNPDWKNTRSKYSPIFSIGKIKGMLPIIANVAEDLNQYILKRLGKIEAKELCSKYTVNAIAKCFFGIDALCFESEKDSDFRKFGRTLTDFKWRNTTVQMLQFLRPNLTDFLRLNMLEKRVATYFSEAFLNTMNIREKSNIRVNDMIDILNDLRKSKAFRTDDSFVDEKLIAQAIAFYLAGSDTSSSTIAYTLYELSKHPDIQNKLRKEIISKLKEHQGLTYEGLNEMKYLEKCVSETLRKYPPLPFLDRRCIKDYQIPGTDLVIEKGVPVYIPIYSLHLDQELFPEPQKYDPDRFTNETLNSNGFTYLPFGEGPRNCMGMRLGMMMTKIALISILSKFEVGKTAETPDPVEFQPGSVMLISKVGLPIRFNTLPVN